MMQHSTTRCSVGTWEVDTHDVAIGRQRATAIGHAHMFGRHYMPQFATAQLECKLCAVQQEHLSWWLCAAAVDAGVLPPFAAALCGLAVR